MSNFPGGYDEYGQYDPNRQAPRQSSGCLRGCGIAAIILVILLAILIGIGVWFYNQIAKGVTQDPEEVLRRLRERFPTAQMPAGYTGRAGFRLKMGFEIDLLVFAKGDAEIGEEGNIAAGNAMILFHAKVPGEGNANVNINPMNERNRVVEKKPFPLRVGDYRFEASWQKVAAKDGPQNQTKSQIEVWLSPDTVLIMQGDDDDVDETSLREFLLTIAKDCRSARRVKDDDAAEDNPAPKKQSTPTKPSKPAKEDADPQS